MKLGLLVILASFSLVSGAQSGATDSVMQAAYSQASKEKKNVFVIFTASWCGWCKKMDKSMADPNCKKFFDNSFIITHLVVDESKPNKALEHAGATEFRKKYNGDGKGIPFWLVFDSKGNLLGDSNMRKDKDDASEGDNTGCPASEKEVNHFIEVLKKTTSLTGAELAIIKQRFRENDQ